MSAAYAKSLCVGTADALRSARAHAQDLEAELQGTSLGSRVRDLSSLITKTVAATESLRLDLALQFDGAWDGIDPESSAAYQEAKAEIAEDDAAPVQLRLIDTTGLAHSLSRLDAILAEFDGDRQVA
jgi:hypothetical protein